MLDAKRFANCPPDRLSTKESDTTFQRILQLTEQVCRRFETKWHPASQNARPAKKSPSERSAALQRR